MSPRNIAAYAAAGLTASFALLVALLHLLEPQFDPSWRLISEYALGRYGWMMAVAFGCLAAACVALVCATWPSTHTTVGRVGQILLGLVGLALATAAVFTTDPITAPGTTAAGDIHNAAAYIVILGFPIAATLVSRALRREPGWHPARRRIRWLTLLVWTGLVGFLGTVIAMADNGRLGPDVLAGWPNRLMMATYTLWLLAIAHHASSAGRRTRT